MPRNLREADEPSQSAPAIRHDLSVQVVYSSDEYEQAINLFDNYRRLEKNIRDLFSFLLMTDRSSYAGSMYSLHQGLLDKFHQLSKELLAENVQLESQLQKHRRPKRNGERDAEIMRLHAQRKTAGEIIRALKPKWALTDKQVTSVISRERRKSQAKSLAR